MFYPPEKTTQIYIGKDVRNAVDAFMATEANIYVYTHTHIYICIHTHTYIYQIYVRKDIRNAVYAFMVKVFLCVFLYVFLGKDVRNAVYAFVATEAHEVSVDPAEQVSLSC